MNSKRDNRIYIYDSTQQKIIMIDSETGEKIEEKDDKVTSILKYLKKEGRETELRKFAVWCAHQTNERIKPIQNKILELAEQAIEKNIEREKLAELYEETEGTAVATDTVGLRQGSQSAPAYLAVRECINPDPLEGAIQSARFHRLWADMKDKNEESKSGASKKGVKDVSAGVENSRIKDAEQKQINYLLDLIGKDDPAADSR